MSRFVIKQSSRVIKVPKHSLFLSLFRDMSYDLTGLSFFFKNRMSRTILNKMCMLSTSCCTSILLVKIPFSLLLACQMCYQKGVLGWMLRYFTSHFMPYVQHRMLKYNTWLLTGSHLFLRNRFMVYGWATCIISCSNKMNMSWCSSVFFFCWGPAILVL